MSLVYNKTKVPMNYKNSFLNGAMMTVGILGSTFVVKKVKKDMAPQLTSNSMLALGVVTILSRLLIDYGKDNMYLPISIG